MLMLFFFVFRSKSRGGVYYIYKGPFFLHAMMMNSGFVGYQMKKRV